jgi:hypothetical protein
MEVIANQIEQGTRVVRTLLEYLNIQPESYRFLFPAGKDSETIRQLVTDGVFPLISSLAPAFMYAIALSVVRYVLNHAILKVSYSTAVPLLAYESHLMVYSCSTISSFSNLRRLR